MNNTNQVIAFCFDKNYAKYCQVALFSLLVSNGGNITVYCVFTEDVSQIDLDNIKLLSTRFNVNLQFLKVPDVSEITNFNTSFHFTKAIFLRLLLPDLLLKEDKILYLDCDVIVNKSLANLYDTNLEHYKYAGVIDKNASITSNIDPTFKKNYVNSGVLLMNLKGLREDNSFKKMKELYDQYASTLTWVDQCLINIYAHQNLLILDEKYNLQISAEGFDKKKWVEISGNGAIFHFVGGTKPWHKRSRKHISDFWWGYANLLHSDQLQPVKNNTLNDMILEYLSLEDDENYKESCKVKEGILIALASFIKRNNLGDFRDFVIDDI